MHLHTPDDGGTRRAVAAANTRAASPGVIAAAAAVWLILTGLAYHHMEQGGWPAVWAFILGIVLAKWSGCATKVLFRRR